MVDPFNLQKYDPRYGISKEDFEWRHSQDEKARRQVSEALHKVQIEAEKVQCHFYDDPDALQVWNEYMDDVRCAASRNLVYTLSSHAKGSLQQLLFAQFKFHDGQNILALNHIDSL